MARGMGAFAAVAQGSHAEPRLIVLRYRPSGASGPHLGFVGKAVTFDTGGISIKPSAKMQEMKFDMSGGAAVIESMAAIAELGLPVHDHRRRAVDREHAERPRGQAGRHRHRDERQDDRGEQHRRRGPPDPGRRALLRGRAGRRADRRPGHADRRDPRRARPHLRGPVLERRRLVRRGRAPPATPPARSAGACRSTRSTSSSTKGQYADLTNAAEQRVAMSSYAAEFLRQFVDDQPWVHIDIAGTAWGTEPQLRGQGRDRLRHPPADRAGPHSA